MGLGQNSRRLGERAGAFAHDKHPEIANVVGVLGVSVLDIFNYASWTLFAPLAGVTGLAVFLSHKRDKHLQARLERIDALEEIVRDGNRNYFEVWNDRAREIGQALDLSPRQRLSFYRFDQKTEEFFLIGRYADHSEHNKRNTVRFPKEVGVLSRSWFEGECYEGKLPNPQSQTKKYEEACLEKYKMPVEMTRNVRMQSQCLWGRAIRNSDNEKVAVVLIESTKREDLNKESLGRRFDIEFEEDIALTLQVTKFMEPSVEIASGIGIQI